MAEIQARQAIPVFYTMEAQPFRAGTAGNSGIAGSVARLSYKFGNDPHRIYGLRVTNYYDLPQGSEQSPPSEANLALWQACKEIDDDQSLLLDITQLTIIANRTHQRLICGKSGIHWHPFSTPYIIEGGNTFSLEVTRLVGYPATIGSTAIVPYCQAVLWCDRMVTGDAAHEGPATRRHQG